MSSRYARYNTSGSGASRSSGYGRRSRKMVRMSAFKRRRVGMRTYRRAPNMRFGYQAASRQEFKAFDTLIFRSQTNSANPFPALFPNNSNTQLPLLVNGPKLGTDVFERIGRKIVMKAVYLRFNVGFIPGVATDATGPAYAPGANNGLPTSVRCLLIYDKQNNGTQPTVGTIFENTTNVTRSPSTAPLALGFRDRFVALWDRHFNFNINHRTMETVKVYKKLNLETIFTQGVSTDPNDHGNTQSGALWFVYLGDQFGAIRTPAYSSQYNANYPTNAITGQSSWCCIADFACRIRYVDS